MRHATDPTLAARQRRAAALLPGAALLSLLSCGPRSATSEVEFLVPVSVTEVRTDSLEDRVMTTGTLRAVEVVTLATQAPGTLRYGRHPDGRRVAEGDRLEAGFVLAEIQGEEAKLAARTEATERRYQAALREYESSKTLFEEGLINEMEFRQAESRLAEARLEWERSLLTEKRTQLTSPFEAIVLQLGRQKEEPPAADGQLVEAGFVVAKLAPLRRLACDIALVGPDVSRVRPGQLVRLRHYAWPDRTFSGRISRLAPSVDPQTRAFLAEAAVDNPEGLLRPGMFVEATIVVDRRENVPVVPREAVTERAGSPVAFVVEGQRVKQRRLVLGLGDDEIVEVREGLKPGERVVVRGVETLTDDARVRVSGG